MSTADKLLSALALFTFETPEWTTETAANALDVSGSTASRYFGSLTRAGLLDPISGGRYILGPAIIAYDRQLRNQDPLLTVSRPIIERLVQRNGGEGVALLCRRFRQQVMCVHQYFEHRPDHAVSYERGRPMGLYKGASSLVILANLSARHLRAVYTADAGKVEEAALGRSWEEFKLALRRIRNGGACVTYGQLDQGMVGIAAPIFQVDRQIAGSIGIVLSQSKVGSNEVAGAAALTQAAAKEINAGLIALFDDRSRGKETT